MHTTSLPHDWCLDFTLLAQRILFDYKGALIEKNRTQKCKRDNGPHQLADDCYQKKTKRSFFPHPDLIKN